MKLLDVMTSPWWIAPSKLEEIREIYCAHMRGPKIDWNGIEARILSMGGRDADDECGYENINSVAVIPIQGVMSKSKSFFSWMFGGCSMRKVGQALQAALNDYSVKSVLLYIDSPGGTVDGTQELSDLIFNARGSKPIVAFTDGAMASAAYYAGSGADKIYISSDTTEVGSIGTVLTHIDQSAWDAQVGDKYTHIASGKYKTAGSPHKPLAKEDKDYFQDQIDYLNGGFIDAVARNRGVTRERAVEMSDEARIYIGKQAIDAGLVDGVSTYDELLNKLAAGDAASFVVAKSKQEDRRMDAKELQAKFPEVYQSIFEEGKAAGFKSGTDAGKEEGATAERQRIAEVRAQLIAGHEALIESLAMDGKTTGPEAAVKVLAAEKAIRMDAAAKLEKDAAAAQGVKSADNTPPPAEEEGETAKSRSEAGDKLDKFAKEIKTKEGVSYSDALAKALAAHPKLAAVYNGKEE